MNKNRIEEVLLGVSFGIFVTICSCFGVKKLRRTLVIRKLINKNTKKINIYTKDYVKILGIKAVKDLKNGDVTSVFTDKAKEFAYNENYDDTYFLYGKFEDEKKQIFSYLKEILLFAPNTKVVINVASVEKEKEYIDLKFFTGLIKKIPLNIEVKIDKSNEIFVEE